MMSNIKEPCGISGRIGIVQLPNTSKLDGENSTLSSFHSADELSGRIGQIQLPGTSKYDGENSIMSSFQTL